jgi:hypothetical protein
MPTILNENGFRFYFYSHEHDPAHIHVIKDNYKVKINLLDMSLMDNKGMKPKDLKEVIEIVVINRELFLEKWNLNFNNA